MQIKVGHLTTYCCDTMEEAGDARSDDVDEVGDGDLLVLEEVHSGEEALADLEGSLSEKPHLISAKMLASSS